MARESEKHKRMVESVRLREENETLKERIKDLQEENKKLKSINSGLDWQGDFDKLKVNYQWGKFKYYTEKLDNLITEMKGKIGDEAEENEYEIFLKERLRNS